ncbi:hypothetical protein ACI0FM_12865 [Paenochrobactrum sp. BZR 588]|uniref:hypothetical protein n=1 Tax=Paenochrobactrum TaxID=999488 RepID=UPI0035BC8C93
MGDGRFNKIEILQFIEDMLCDMRIMAKSTDCHVLVYLLEMAVIESRDQIEAEENQSVGVRISPSHAGH